MRFQIANTILRSNSNTTRAETKRFMYQLVTLETKMIAAILAGVSTGGGKLVGYLVGDGSCMGSFEGKCTRIASCRSVCRPEGEMC